MPWFISDMGEGHLQTVEELWRPMDRCNVEAPDLMRFDTELEAATYCIQQEGHVKPLYCKVDF